jgi:hypothetical protein
MAIEAECHSVCYLPLNVLLGEGSVQVSCTFLNCVVWTFTIEFLVSGFLFCGCFLCVVLGFELRALGLLGRCSTSRAMPQIVLFGFGFI